MRSSESVAPEYPACLVMERVMEFTPSSLEYTMAEVSITVISAISERESDIVNSRASVANSSAASALNR